jgi:hypothetical protein
LRWRRFGSRSEPNERSLDPTMSGCRPVPVIRGNRSSLPPVAKERKSTELVEQRLSVLQISGVEALGEPAVDRREQVKGLGAPALLRP